MKTLLDLIQEFALLYEAKTLGGGVLPAAAEERFRELHAFYDLLMAQDGLARNPAARFSAAEIRETVAARERLRVRTDMETVALTQAEAQQVRVGNVSRGGALLHCDRGFGVGTGLTLHLASLDRAGGLMSADSAVVWQSDDGVSRGTYRFRVGLQYVRLDDSARTGLDTLVVDSLEAKLLSLRREALDAEFVRRERLAL